VHREMAVEDERAAKEGQQHLKTRKVTMWNFILPTIWHRIDVEDRHTLRHGTSHKVIRTWTEKSQVKAYEWDEGQKSEPGVRRGGEPYWNTYAYQLEEFVNRVKARPGSGVWISGEDSIAQMKWIDATYEKAGLPLRPTSGYE
jgi:hypothetical protein